MLNLCFRTFNVTPIHNLYSCLFTLVKHLKKMKNEKPLIILLFQENNNNDDSKLNMKVIIKVLKV